PYGMMPYGSNTYMPGYSGMTSNYGSASMSYGQAGMGTAQARSPAALLGVPVEKGHIRWPLGLRVLPPADETKTLREQLDALLPTVASQAALGQASPALVEQGLDAIHALRKLLRPREGTMAEVTYTDAMRFLDRVERGFTKL